MANANVGDQPQIADEDADDDLFGDRRLDAEGKKLKRTLKKRNGTDAFDSDSVSLTFKLVTSRLLAGRRRFRRLGFAEREIGQVYQIYQVRSERDCCVYAAVR